MSVARSQRPDSSLSSRVRPGKKALRKPDRSRVLETASTRLLDSLDLDEATRSRAPGLHRWDYLLGTTASQTALIAAEIHPANTGEARLLVAKKRAALELLGRHLAPGRGVRRWFWIASGTTKITRGSPEARLLDQAGIRLVGGTLKLGDL